MFIRNKWVGISYLDKSNFETNMLSIIITYIRHDFKKNYYSQDMFACDLTFWPKNTYKYSMLFYVIFVMFYIMTCTSYKMFFTLPPILTSQRFQNVIFKEFEFGRIQIRSVREHLSQWNNYFRYLFRYFISIPGVRPSPR